MHGGDFLSSITPGLGTGTAVSCTHVHGYGTTVMGTFTTANLWGWVTGVPGHDRAANRLNR
jgi:hypothetical protein